MNSNVTKQPLISVIVPVYNIIPYLPRCVESLRTQTYENLEILLIDDGSTDETPALCDRLATEDERIRVFHKKNGGPSSARNFGLQQAVGEYVGFVDSDDYVDADMYERLRRGESLTAQEAAALIPSRTEFVAVWRYLSGHARLGRVEDTARRLARSVARTYGIKETVMRTMVCLEVLDEHGLIQVEQSTDHLRISVQEVSGKVDLEASKLLRHLRRLAEEA